MQFVKMLGLVLLAGVLTVAAMMVYKMSPKIGTHGPAPIITTFEDCVAAGNAVMESYPRQCRTPDGGFFVEDTPDIQVPPLPPENPATTANNCVPAGCSQQLCVSADKASEIVTTCEYRSEYACYQSALCEMQTSGECGWTQTPELAQCLSNPPKMDVEGDIQVQ